MLYGRQMMTIGVHSWTGLLFGQLLFLPCRVGVPTVEVATAVLWLGTGGMSGRMQTNVTQSACI